MIYISGCNNVNQW